MNLVQLLKDHGLEIGLVVAILALIIQLARTRMQVKQIRIERDKARTENEMYNAAFQLEQLVQAGKGVAFPLNI